MWHVCSSQASDEQKGSPKAAVTGHCSSSVDLGQMLWGSGCPGCEPKFYGPLVTSIKRLLTS